MKFRPPSVASPSRFGPAGRLTIVPAPQTGAYGRDRGRRFQRLASGPPTRSFTQQVIASFGRPIAATSANTSGRPSPAAFEEVEPAVVDAVDLAVDGGKCPISVHSSVVDFSVLPPRVLRAGAISPAELSAGLGVTVR